LNSDHGDQLGVPIRDHTDAVWSVAYLLDDTIVSGSFDGTIRFWYDNGELADLACAPLSHESGVWAIAIGRNKQLVVSGHGKGISLWQGHVFPEVHVSHRHIEGDKQVRCVAFSPDAKIIVHGSDGNAVYLLDGRFGRSTTLQPIAPPLVGHTNSILSVAFSPDGSRVASGSMDKTIRIWDVPAQNHWPPPGECNMKLTAVSRDGKALGSVSMNDYTQLWDLRASPPARHALETGPPGFKSCFNCVAFSADGSCVTGGGSDGIQALLYLWNTSTRQLIGFQNLLEVPPVTSLCFVPSRNAFSVTASWWGSQVVELWFTLEGEIKSGPTFDDESGEDDYEWTASSIAFHDMDWFRPKRPGLGLWVFLDNCVIRASHIGSTMNPLTIIPYSTGS